MDSSLDRRGFIRLTLGTILILPAGRFLVACGSSEEDPLTGEDMPAAPPRADGTGVVYSSTNDEGHFHTFRIEMSAMASPPSGGVSGDTSSVGGHSHDLSISMAELASVAAGQSVRITTSDVGGHTHVLTFGS